MPHLSFFNLLKDDESIGWVFCCCVSACCAGMLCTMLWAHFLNAPTVLSLLGQHNHGDSWFPTIGVCATPDRLAQLFAQKMSLDEHDISVGLPTLFYNLQRGKALSNAQLALLEHVLAKRRMFLADALANVTEPCNSLLRVCRLQDHTVPCDRLFQKQVSPMGVCCVTNADAVKAVSGEGLINPKLGLLLECSGTDDDSILNSCEFFARFPHQEWVSHVELTTGYIYRVPLIFTAIKDSNKEKLVDGTCVSRLDYSRRKCFIKCKERKCGCSDPLSIGQDDDDTLEPCTLSQMNCLKNFKLVEDSCNCPSSCRRIYSASQMESSRIDEHTFDPVNAKANASSTILEIWVQHSASKTFDHMYTQTWWSLLSSLGGLFSMFLGVGFLSALEVIFLLVQCLRLSFHRSSRAPGARAYSS